RRRIEIKRIADRSRRVITFNKRRKGLEKKVYELSVLTGCYVSLLIKAEDGTKYPF
ncbi:hypothetical protein B0I35DRAFT_323803, partial [Stachybotrys elegans]